MPAPVLTKKVSQTNALAGKIGSAAHCQRPALACSRVIKYSDRDISKTSNSSFMRLRKNSSGGVVTTISRSSLADLTVPSMRGSKRGFLVTATFNFSIRLGLFRCQVVESYIRRRPDHVKPVDWIAA